MKVSPLIRLLLATPLIWWGSGCSSNVVSGPMPTGVAALGRLEPATGVLSVGGMLGDRVEKVEEDTEKVFKEGDVLGQLASWKDRNFEVALAQKQLEEGRKRYDAIKAQGESQIAEAEKKLLQLRQQKDPDLAGQAKVLALIAKRKEQAESTLRDMLASAGVTRPQSEQQRAIVSALEVEHATAQLQLDKAKQTYDFGISQAEMGLQTAKLTLARYLSEVPLPVLEETVKAAEVKREHSVLKAPTYGRVLKVMTRPGEPVSTVPILQFGNTDAMIAIAEVYETDVTRLKVGQKAQVRFQESSPEVPEFVGTITQIGRLVSSGTILDLNPAAPTDRRVIEVRVALDSPSKLDPSRFVLRQVRVEFPGQP